MMPGTLLTSAGRLLKGAGQGCVAPPGRPPEPGLRRTRPPPALGGRAPAAWRAWACCLPLSEQRERKSAPRC